MATKIFDVFGTVSLDDKKLNAGLDKLKNSLKKVSLGILAIGGVALKLASDFQETSAKFNTAFRGIEGQADKTAQALRRDFGLSELEAKKLLGTTGDLLKGFGATGTQALGLSNTVQELAVDLASYNNLQGGAARASEILTKAMLGEREGLIALGTKVSEADVKTELLARGQEKLTGQALLLAKAQITLALVTKQSGDAQGDFARTSDSFANQLKTLKGEAVDLAVSFGQELLPAATELIEGIRGLVEWFTDLEPATKKTIIQVAALVAIAPAVIGGIQGISRAIGFLASNPIVLVIAAVGALVVALAQASAASKNFDGELQEQRKSLELINKTIDKADALQKQANETQALIDRYVELNSISNRTAGEQEELSGVIAQLGKDLPGAATAWDEYGVAVTLNADKANEAVVQILESRKRLLEASKAALEAQKVQAEQTQSEIQADLAEARRNRDSATQALTDAQNFRSKASELLGEVEFATQIKDQDYLNEKVLESIDALEKFNQITAEEAEEFRNLGDGGRFVTQMLRDAEAAAKELGKEQLGLTEKADELEQAWAAAEQIGLDLATTTAELNAIDKQLITSTEDLAAAENDRADENEGFAEDKKEADEAELLRLEELEEKQKELALLRREEGEEIIVSQGKINALVKELNDQARAAEKEAKDRAAEEDKARNAQTMADTRQVAALTTSLISQLFQNRQQEMNNYYTTERDAIENSLLSEEEKAVAIAALDEEIKTRQRKFARDKAIADKAAAAFNIGLNTAVGISTALATANPLLASIIAGLGALQLTAVLSEPLPALAKGALVNPTAGGTQAVIGEGGNAEAVIPLTPGVLGQLGNAIANATQSNSTINNTTNNNYGKREINLNMDSRQICKIIDEGFGNGQLPKLLRATR